MKAIFSSLPLPQFDTVYALLRITTGFLMLLHGWEVFDPTLMAEYGKWLNDLHFPAPQFMAWLGKGTELVAGACLMLGLAVAVFAGNTIVSRLTRPPFDTAQ